MEQISGFEGFLWHCELLNIMGEVVEEMEAVVGTYATPEQLRAVRNKAKLAWWAACVTRHLDLETHLDLAIMLETESKIARIHLRGRSEKGQAYLDWQQKLYEEAACRQTQNSTNSAELTVSRTGRGTRGQKTI